MKILVENVCNDKRVRNYFAFKEPDLEIGTSEAQRMILGMKDKSSSTKVEFTSNVDKDAWRRFYFYASRCLAAGSKIIVTSPTDDCAN